MTTLTPTDLKHLRVLTRDAMKWAEAEGRPGPMADLAALLGTLEQLDPHHDMREELDNREILEALDENGPSQ